MNILIVDDDPLWLFNLRKKMPAKANVLECRSRDTAMLHLENKEIDLALIDLDINGELDGLELVDIAAQKGIYSVVLTSHDEDGVIEKGYARGAKDFITKPMSDRALSNIMERFETFKGQSSRYNDICSKFITQDRDTLEVLKTIGNLKQSKKAVLLQGPSGTGKTHLAKIIHDVTHGDNAAFVSLNCAQFNEMTIDSELFGHKKGSFTGAHENKEGLIKTAEGGTLFLDEVHGLSAKAQLKLLTALDQGIIYPLGANKPEKVDFKVICATSEDLEDLVRRGHFRRDLFYRIRTFVFNLKGLGQRTCDIVPLINHSIEKFERKVFISDEAKDILENYDWPGNVREVNDLVENWNAFGVGIVGPEELPAKMTLMKKIAQPSNKIEKDDLPDELFTLGLKGYIDQIKEELILKTLEKHGGKQIDAAKALMISKSHMSKEIARVRSHER